MTYIAWSSFDFFGTEMELFFKFDYLEGAPEHHSIHGWQPQEPAHCDVVSAWLVTAKKDDPNKSVTGILQLDDKFVDALQEDCNMHGEAWNAVLEAVLDGP